MDVDTARVAVVPGGPNEIVARFPGVLCVARCSEPDLVATLLQLCADVSGHDPGRPLARALARWLTGADDLPDRIDFGTVSRVGDQVAVFLSGAVGVEVDDLTLSGTDAAAWTDRLLPAPYGPFQLALHGAAGWSASTGPLNELLDLRAGIVSGAGALLRAGTAGRSPAERPGLDQHPSGARPANRSVVRRPPAPSAPGRDADRGLPPVRPTTPAPDRSPLAPDGPPRASGNGARSEPPLSSPRSGSGAGPASDTDEDFSAGEWFTAGQGPEGDGRAGGAPQRTAAQGPDRGPQLVRDARGGEPDRPVVENDGPREPSPWATPPPPGRHAVHVPLARADDEGSGTVVADPPTPRNGAATLVGAVPVDREPVSVRQAVPSPRSAPVVAASDGAAVAVESDDADDDAPREEDVHDDSVDGAGISRGQNGHRFEDPPGADRVDPAEQAQGQMCSRGHLNDPRSQSCAQCGARMSERSTLVTGPRPPLGTVVFDDGASYTVDAEYLVGRMPESDDRVATGELRAIVVEDRSGAVSRVHAEIRIEGWDVLLADSGSRNGTFVAGPTQQGWSPLPPGRSRRLVPGTRVRLGGRTFVFEAPTATA